MISRCIFSIAPFRQLLLRICLRQASSVEQSSFSHRRTIMTSKNLERKYKLKYFNFKVLGEPIRWQFVLAGVPFVDERLPRDTWDVEGKNSIGWGRLPVLVIDDEIEISQSCAISRFLAKEFGQLPETDILKAHADELVDNLQDLRLCWRPWVRESDPEKKKQLEQTMLNIYFPFYFPKINAFVRKHGQNGFAVGGKLSWADLYLANFLQIWTGNHGSEILTKYPLLQAHMNEVLNIPQIKAWNEARPETKY